MRWWTSVFCYLMVCVSKLKKILYSDKKQTNKQNKNIMYMQPFTWTATFPLWWKRGQRAYCCAVQDTQRMLSFVPYIINIGVEIPNKQTAEQRHGKGLHWLTLITIRMISQVWGQRATDVKCSHYPRTWWHSTTDNVLISHSLYSLYSIWRFGSSLSLFKSGVCVAPPPSVT